MNQCEMILKHFKNEGAITDSAARSHYGIARLAARIYDLTRHGHIIVTTIVTGKNRFGDKTRFASYRLVK